MNTKQLNRKTLTASCLFIAAVQMLTPDVGLADRERPRSGTETHGTCPGPDCRIPQLRYSTAPRPVESYRDGDVIIERKAYFGADMLPEGGSIRFAIEVLKGQAQFLLSDLFRDVYAFDFDPNGYEAPRPIWFGPGLPPANDPFALISAMGKGVWKKEFRYDDLRLYTHYTPRGPLRSQLIGAFIKLDLPHHLSFLPTKLRYTVEILGASEAVLRTPIDIVYTLEKRTKKSWVTTQMPMIRLIKESASDGSQ
jgi:hypothetical protein